MKTLKLLPILMIMGITANAQDHDCTEDACCKKETTFKCKLTTPELRERKATVIGDLKKIMREKKELKDGYAYKFSGSDDVVAKLNEFIKTESECCDFFVFKIDVTKNKSAAWLHITGEKGVTDFLKGELDMKMITVKLSQYLSLPQKLGEAPLFDTQLILVKTNYPGIMVAFGFIVLALYLRQPCKHLIGRVYATYTFYY